MLNTIEKIQKRNEAAGNKFFAPDMMAQFGTRLSQGVYGDGFFVTSEEMGARHRGERCRRYSVRRCDVQGNIETIGEVGMFATLGRAKLAAKAASEGRLEFWVMKRCAGYLTEATPSTRFPWHRWEDMAQEALRAQRERDPGSLYVLSPMVSRRARQAA